MHGEQRCAEGPGEGASVHVREGLAVPVENEKRLHLRRRGADGFLEAEVAQGHHGVGLDEEAGSHRFEGGRALEDPDLRAGAPEGRIGRRRRAPSA